MYLEKISNAELVKASLKQIVWGHGAVEIVVVINSIVVNRIPERLYCYHTNRIN